MFVVLWAAFWITLIPAALCMILVRGRRLATLGIAAAWLLLNVVVFGIGLVHCYTGCVDEPWYVLWSVVATVAIGVFLIVLFTGWIIRRKTLRVRQEPLTEQASEE